MATGLQLTGERIGLMYMTLPTLQVPRSRIRLLETFALATSRLTLLTELNRKSEARLTPDELVRTMRRPERLSTMSPTVGLGEAVSARLKPVERFAYFRKSPVVAMCPTALTVTLLATEVCGGSTLLLARRMDMPRCLLSTSVPLPPATMAMLRVATNLSRFSVAESAPTKT